jgi:hypothetical protein
MGESKRRRQLDSGYGKNSKVQLKLASTGYLPMVVPPHLKNEETAEFSHLVPVLITRDDEAVPGAVLFSYRENTDGSGIDDFTGEKHNEQFHLTTKVAAFKSAKWLAKVMRPKANGLAEISALANEVAKKAIRQMH